MTARAIAVAVDGSRASEYALRWAFEEAEARHRPLTVVTAWPLETRLTLPPDASGEWLARSVATAAIDEILGAEGGGVRIWVPGRPAAAAAVLRWVSRRVELLVLGQGGVAAAGEQGERSVSRPVLAGGACVVAVVGSAPAARWARIVVGTDESSAGRAAWEWARQHSVRTGAELVAVPAGETEPVVPALVAAATAADLVVVGLRSDSAPGGVGAVCAGLVRNSPVPLVVVPPPTRSSVCLVAERQLSLAAAGA